MTEPSREGEFMASLRRGVPRRSRRPRTNIEYPPSVTAPYFRQPGEWWIVIAKNRPFVVTCTSEEQAKTAAIHAGDAWLETIYLDTTVRLTPPRWRTTTSVYRVSNHPGRCPLCEQRYPRGTDIIGVIDVLENSGRWAHAECAAKRQLPEADVGTF